MFFHVGDEGLADEEATHDEENVDAMRQWDLRYEIEGGILNIMLSMAMYYAKDSKSPQQIQAEDALAVNINAPKVLHWWQLFSMINAFQI